MSCFRLARVLLMSGQLFPFSASAATPPRGRDTAASALRKPIFTRRSYSLLVVCRVFHLFCIATMCFAFMTQIVVASSRRALRCKCVISFGGAVSRRRLRCVSSCVRDVRFGTGARWAWWWFGLPSR